MTRTVIVPLDGSERAERATPIAASIASRASATLRLIHVHSGGTTGFAGMETAERYIRGLVERIRGTVPMITGDVMRGHVLDTLRHESAARPTGWIVMTAGGAGGERHGLGTIAASLVSSPGAPIVLCGPSMPGCTVRGIARTAESIEIDNIAIALDGSADTEAALPRAVHFARLHGARLTLISVVRDDAAQADSRARYLDAIAARLDAADLPVSRRVVRSCDAAGALIRAALEEDADAIAVGRGYLSRDPSAATIIAGARQPLLL